MAIAIPTPITIFAFIIAYNWTYKHEYIGTDRLRFYQKSFWLFALILLNLLWLEPIFAEPVMITASSKMENVVFDGKWTFEREWKPSSLNNILGEHLTYIRTAHFKENVYVLIDVIWDTSLDERMDYSMICFDTKNDKSLIPNEDDYCFKATVGSADAITLHGNSGLSEQNYFEEIENFSTLIAIGSVSDENDRYDPLPHASYEFRIPTDVISRTDNYGFLVYVYDASTDKVVTWPQQIEIDENKSIPSPSQWGDLVSPDKSLPEFNWPILVLLPSFLFIIILTRRIKFRITH